MDGQYAWPTLPVELVHLILRQLGRDELIACTSVCRTWLELSLPYLLENYRYTLGPLAHPDLEPTANGEPSPTSRTLENLLRELHASNILRTSIRHLTLIQRRTLSQGRRRIAPNLDNGSLKFSIPLPISISKPSQFHDFVQVLQSIPGLHTVVLDSIALEISEEPFSFAPLVRPTTTGRAWKSVKFTRWAPAGQHHKATIFHILSLFDEIEELSFGSVPFLRTLTATHDASQVSTRIHCLSLEEPQLCDYLLPIPGLAHLHALDIPYMRDTDGPVICRLLEKTSDTLRSISFMAFAPLSPFVTRTSAYEPFTLPNLSMLESASFTVCMYGLTSHVDQPTSDPPTHMSMLPWTPFFYTPAYTFICDTIAQLPRHVRSITLDLRYCSADPSTKELVERNDFASVPTNDDWTALEHVLVSCAERGLARLELRDKVWGRLLDAEMEHLKQCMPALWATGIVAV